MTRNEVVEAHYKKNHEKLIKLMAYRFGNDTQDGEDVVHTAYERSLLYFDKWDSATASFETWFGAILINCEKDLKREKRNQGMVIDHNVPLIDDNGEEVIADSVVEIIDDTYSAERLQDLHGVRKFIDKQPDSIRNVLMLYYVYQYSLSDIESLLGIGYKKVDNLVKDFRIRAIREKRLV